MPLSQSKCTRRDATTRGQVVPFQILILREGLTMNQKLKNSEVPLSHLCVAEPLPVPPCPSFASAVTVLIAPDGLLAGKVFTQVTPLRHTADLNHIAKSCACRASDRTRPHCREAPSACPQHTVVALTFAEVAP